MYQGCGNRTEDSSRRSIYSADCWDFVGIHRNRLVAWTSVSVPHSTDPVYWIIQGLCVSVAVIITPGAADCLIYAFSVAPTLVDNGLEIW